MQCRSLVFAIFVVAVPIGAQSAPRVTTQLAVSELASLEEVRKAVWVDWFSGDTAALRRALAPELVAITPGSKHWQTLEESLASSAKFSAGGGKFVSVAFDSSAIHRFGETVVMFSHYAVVTDSKEGRSTQKGKATEVFVRVNGRWVHTSWHLDAES
jgi:hypothetical protein